MRFSAVARFFRRIREGMDCDRKKCRYNPAGPFCCARYGHSLAPGKGMAIPGERVSLCVSVCMCGLANRKTGNHQGLHSGFACVLTKLPKRPISSGSLSGYGNGRFSECGFVEMLFLFPGLVTLFPQTNGEREVGPATNFLQPSQERFQQLYGLLPSIAVPGNPYRSRPPKKKGNRFRVDGRWV